MSQWALSWNINQSSNCYNCCWNRCPGVVIVTISNFVSCCQTSQSPLQAESWRRSCKRPRPWFPWSKMPPTSIPAKFQHWNLLSRKFQKLSRCCFRPGAFHWNKSCALLLGSLIKRRQRPCWGMLILRWPTKPMGCRRKTCIPCCTKPAFNSSGARFYVALEQLWRPLSAARAGAWTEISTMYTLYNNIVSWSDYLLIELFISELTICQFPNVTLSLAQVMTSNKLINCMYCQGHMMTRMKINGLVIVCFGIEIAQPCEPASPQWSCNCTACHGPHGFLMAVQRCSILSAFRVHSE